MIKELTKKLTLRALKFLFIMAFICQFALTSVAQEQDTFEPMPSGPRRQITTIIFAGLAGAILGLSTLSFYGRPQDKLSNIAIGFALGIIGGTVFTTYQTATRPYGYALNDPYHLLNDVELETRALLSPREEPLASSPQTLTLNYSIKF